MTVFYPVLVDISSVVIGEPEVGLWCSTCQLPSAVLVKLALLIKPFALESYEIDTVSRMVTMHVCEWCGGMFEMPDSPVLIDNRG